MSKFVRRAGWGFLFGVLVLEIDYLVVVDPQANPALWLVVGAATSAVLGVVLRPLRFQ